MIRRARCPRNPEFGRAFTEGLPQARVITLGYGELEYRQAVDIFEAPQNDADMVGKGLNRIARLE